MFKTFNQDIHFGDKVINVETGYFANQADGAVMAKCGGTVVMCVVCSAKEDNPDTDFFPLTVNYIEKAYACGKIPGGFFKREGKQSDREILISRLIDRPIRPIFVDGYYRTTQIICTLLAYDGKCEPDIVAMVGASTAVAIAGLPTQGVISGCRVGYINGKYVVNPSIEEMKNSKLDIVVAGTTNAVLMVESEAQILTEDEMLGAIATAQEVINSSVEEIKKFVKKVNKEPAVIFVPRDRSKLYNKMKELAGDAVVEAFHIQDKHTRHRALDDIKAQLKEELYNIEMENLQKMYESCDCCDCCCDGKCGDDCKCEDDCDCKTTKGKKGKKAEEKKAPVIEHLVYQGGEPVEMNDVDINLMYEELQSNIVRHQIMVEKTRIDGRALDQVRPIEVKVGVLPQVHGSAVFSRGMTQSLAVATLGTSADEQQQDSLTATQQSQKFILHYNFPGYSAGEATPPKAPGRRELGHGNLARRALAPVIPSQEEFPYTIRVVSEITSSDGSTSQATVCSCCMAMMDMGVPLKAPVAGVAMGLIKEPEGYAVLTDIMADEDHLGDMDFKVAGTKDGITALQMDIKTFGITLEIMRDALAQAKKARAHIMSLMMNALPAPRSELNKNAPKIYTMAISERDVPTIIGKGGANIKKICETSGAKLDIVDNKLTIFADNQQQLAMAVDMVNASLGQIEYGRIFDAIVKSVLPYGAIVDCGYDITGLVHISELSNEGIEPSMVVSEGMNVKVMYVGNDDKGRFKFSMKAVNQETGECGVRYGEDNCDCQGEPIFGNQEKENYNEKRNSSYKHFDRRDRFDRDNRDRRFDKRDGKNFKEGKKKGKLKAILGIFGVKKNKNKEFNGRNHHFKKGFNNKRRK